ncbi:hypothetical protein KBC04_03645 [Candidatus Babeliales bacterium]|nr:hypothetical protein [Candidatus Babeliales bacterium]MBP9843854.1 hypothetical protein [Candidatus Babeliales bacterium]
MKSQKILLLSSIFLIVHALHGSVQLCPSPLPKKYENVQAGSIVAAYFGNWDIYGENHYQIDRVEVVADKLTHLVYGFMKPDDVHAECKPHDIWADVGAYDDVQTKIGGNFAKMIELKKKFPHLKILLSIGGGKYNQNFIKIAQDKAKLFKFAQSCVERLDFYDHPFLLEGKYKRKNHLTYEGLFDGLDIDWEWAVSQVTPELSQAYTEFIHEIRRLLDLRKGLTGREALLTVALQVTPKVYKNLDLVSIARAVDWYNVMAYDFFGPSSGSIGFNAPICGKELMYSVDGALQRIMEQGVSPEKMVLGLPLYGYVYEDSNGYNSTIKSKEKVKAVSYHLIKAKYIDNAAFEKGWSTYEKVPSLYSKKDKVFVTYDGKNSLIDKVELAKNKRMQGVVLWRLSGDDAQHSLVHAVTKAIQV